MSASVTSRLGVGQSRRARAALLFGLLAAAPADAQVPPGDVAIVGGTLVDLSAGGRSTRDRSDVTVVIHHGTIASVGSSRTVRVPIGMRSIDARGKYVLPGLIDGFGSLRTPGFSQAYLFEGVTSVYVDRAPAGEDGEQTEVLTPGGPRLLRGMSIASYSGAEPGSQPGHALRGRRFDARELRAQIDRLAASGYRGLMIGLDASPSQVQAIVTEARRTHLAVTGELASTSYPEGIKSGMSYLFRSDHYQTALASDEALDAYAIDPTGKAAGAAYQAACTSPLDGSKVSNLGKQLAVARTGLMPILDIEATADDVGASNPWLARSAVFISAQDLDDPVDPVTGSRPYLASHPSRRAYLQGCALHRQAIDGRLSRLGVWYLAGSGAPAFGIMPGSGLHQELRLFQHIGLTPRQAIAAATTNFADHLGWTDVGEITPGRAGDVVLTTDDPRKDVAALETITTVVHDGVVVDRTAMLAAAKARLRGETSS